MRRARPPGSAKAAADRNLLFLLGGQIASIFGDRINYLAVIALVGAEAGIFLQRDAPFELSKLTLLLFLPTVLLGPFAGVLVDRWNTRRTLIVSDLLRGLVIATVPLFYPRWAGLLHAYAAVALLAAINTFFLPARCAIVPQIVAKDTLLAANTSLTTGAILATMAGTTLGGLLIGAGGWRAGLALDAASYLISTLSLLLMRPSSFMPRPPPVAAETMRGALARESHRFPRELRDGWRAVRSVRPLLFTLLSLFLVVASGGIIVTAGVVYIERLTSNVARDLGLLGGALSVGMVAGSLLCRLVGPRIGERRLLCLSLALTGGSVVAFGAVAGYALLLAVFFAGGVFLAPVVITSETLQQKHCPPSLMGRVFALRDFANRLGFLLAAVPGGFAASRWPLRLVLGAAGGVLVLAALILACVWRGDDEGIGAARPARSRAATGAARGARAAGGMSRRCARRRRRTR